jgi:replicative DNA helicase
MGKTAFVLSMARNTAVDYGKAVALFSLEMSSVQLVKRLISSEARIHAEKLRKGNLREDEFQQLHTRITKLATAPIFIDDTAGLSVFDLRAKCRRLKMQHNIELVIIDYLQLMSAKDGKGGGNREQEISTISRSIKEIAKELNIPIIALSQLSRSVEQRGGDKRPILSDLRESGAIEQDADIVGFIYRPDYYGFLEDEDGNPNNGIGEIIIAKHRNGATDRVRLRFVQEYARFENIESFEGNSMNDTFKNAKNESYTITVPSNFDKVQDSSPEIDLERGEEAPF